MDLSSLETTAAISKHAVVLLASGGTVAGYRAWHFAVRQNERRRLHAQFAVVVLAALGVIAGYSVYYFTDEINLQLRKVAEAKEVELERFKAEKGAEISLASARAAEANERALNLEKSNLPLRKQVATLENANLTLRAQVATLEKRAEDSGKELAVLQVRVADATRKEAEAEIKLAEVRKRQEPRTFQEDIFLSILTTAPPGKIKIGHIQGVPEPATLAGQIGIALRKAKWDVLELKPVVSVIERGYSPSTEIFLMMRDLENMNSSQRALQKALEKAGFQLVLATIRDEQVPANISVLLVGPKH